MIATRIAATFAAGALAVGILTGSAGTIVLRDATATQSNDVTAHMSQMGSMMNGAGGMMTGAGGMMNGAGSMMNGSGGMMGGQSGTSPSSPAGSAMPDWMQQHHVTSSPLPTR